LELEKELHPSSWLYHNVARQYDPFLGKWVTRHFYILPTKGLRNYPSNIKEKDQLLKIRIVTEETKQCQEWVFHKKDQKAMFKEVFKTFVKVEEREKWIKELLDFIKNELNHKIDKF